jgi:hypothetical protein
VTEIVVDGIGKLLLGLVLLATGIVVLLLSRYGVHNCRVTSSSAAVASPSTCR